MNVTKISTFVWSFMSYWTDNQENIILIAQLLRYKVFKLFNTLTRICRILWHTTCSVKMLIDKTILLLLLFSPFKFARTVYNIRKTCPCNEYPLKPHFYIVKMGYAGVYLFFLFLLQNIDCGYSLEPPRRGGSNVYPQSMFWAKIRKLSKIFLWKLSIFDLKKLLYIIWACFRNEMSNVQGIKI